MFPLRSVVIQNDHPASYMPGFGSYLGDANSDAVVRDIKQAAITGAAINIGIQVGLMFVPVFGQAVAAIMSLVQYFTGKHYTKETKALIASTQADIAAYTDQAKTKVNNAFETVYNQEYPTGAALAASGQPLGSWWHDFTDHLNQAIFKPVGHAIKVAPQMITKAAITPVLEAGRVAARVTGNTKLQTVVQKAAKQATIIEQHADPYDQLNVITGRDTYETARQSTADLRTKIYAQIDASVADAVGKINSPEGHQAMQLSIAKAIRSDPTQMAQVQAALQAAASQNSILSSQAQNTQEAIAAMQPTIASTQNTATTVVVGAGIAAVAAAFFFR